MQIVGKTESTGKNVWYAEVCKVGSQVPGKSVVTGSQTTGLEHTRKGENRRKHYGLQRTVLNAQTKVTSELWTELDTVATI